MHNILQIIEESFLADNGKAYKLQLKQALSEIQDAFGGGEGFRRYLGASQIVHECKRKVWYDFRWCARNKFDMRTLYLFNRGHLEEARFIALLRQAGFEVTTINPSTGKQYGFKHGYYQGNCDGILTVSDEFDERVDILLEFKTHNDSSFSTLESRGVKSAKPEHYDQMQIYMYELELPYCLYMAVNKNNDALYLETVEGEEEIGKKYRDMAEELIIATEPPPAIDESPMFWKCKVCSHYRLCKFNDKSELLSNCRTCYCSNFAVDSISCPCKHFGTANAEQGCELYQQKENL